MACMCIVRVKMALCFVGNTGDVTELSTVIERKCKRKTTLKASESEMQSQ